MDTNCVAFFSNSQRAKKHVYQQFVLSTVTAKSRNLGQKWILELFWCKKNNPCINVGRSQRNIETAKAYLMLLYCRLRQETTVVRRAMLKMLLTVWKKIFKPAGELELEEDFESDEKSETALL